MQVTPAVRIGCFIPTPRAFFCSAGALGGSGFTVMRGLFIATIHPHPFVVNFTDTTVGFAPVTMQTQQLDVRRVTAATAGERHDVVVLEFIGAATALTPSAITGIDYFLGRRRNGPAL